MFKRYYIISKITGKHSGIMSFGKALARYNKTIKEEATEAELHEYDEPGCDRDRRLELLRTWSNRCAFDMIPVSYYKTWKKSI